MTFPHYQTLHFNTNLCGDDSTMAITDSHGIYIQMVNLYGPMQVSQQFSLAVIGMAFS